MYVYQGKFDDYHWFTAEGNSVYEILQLYQLGKINIKYIKKNYNFTVDVAIFNPHDYLLKDCNQYYLYLNADGKLTIKDLYEKWMLVPARHRFHLTETISDKTYRDIFGYSVEKMDPYRNNNIEYNVKEYYDNIRRETKISTYEKNLLETLEHQRIKKIQDDNYLNYLYD
jgi:hypothetical protein